VGKIKWGCLQERKTTLANSLAKIKANYNQSAAAIWSDLTDKIHQVASDTLGETKSGKRFVDKQVWWWNENVQQQIKKKKKAYKEWFKFRCMADHQQHKILKATAKRAVAAAKAAHYSQLYERLNRQEAANTRHRSTEDIGPIKQIKDDNHQVQRDPCPVLRRSNEYFSKISNEEFPHSRIQSADSNLGLVPTITTAEVKNAVKKMKNGKATRPDGMPTRVCKIIGQKRTDILVCIFKKIIDEGAAPSISTTSVTVPI
jgi:hypothetical protein